MRPAATGTRGARHATAKHVAYYLSDTPAYYDHAAVEAGFEEIIKAVREERAKFE